jgi:hypothetical protein
MSAFLKNVVDGYNDLMINKRGRQKHPLFRTYIFHILDITSSFDCLAEIILVNPFEQFIRQNLTLSYSSLCILINWWNGNPYTVTVNSCDAPSPLTSFDDGLWLSLSE